NKQVIVLYISTLLGVLCGVGSSIINTRFLDPVDYGDVRYVQNIINFICSILLFGYFLSGSRLLALTEEEQRARRIRGSMVIILGIACLVLATSLYIVSLIKGPETSVSFLFIVSLPVCFYPLFLNYINTVSQGDNHIGRISVARVLPTLIYIPIAYIIYKHLGASPTKMILLQWGIYTAILLSIIISTCPSFRNLKVIFKELNEENKAYGLHLYIGSLVMVASNYIAGITIGMFNVNNAEVGFYTLALTVTSPLAMLPSIIGTSYFKKFATLNKIPAKVMKWSIILTIVSCIVFILLIKWVVIWLYSEKYALAGIYAMWLAVGFSMHGFGDMINRYLGSHGQGKSIRNCSIGNGIFKIFGFTVLVYIMGTAGALLTSVLCSAIYVGMLIYYYLKFTKEANGQI
ncbi:MAG: oligosaccharide flippase family protein, partial [Allobaculum sp.]|nr:oligosaccharide flippase family protein [Allobaculum sp.]